MTYEYVILILLNNHIIINMILLPLIAWNLTPRFDQTNNKLESLLNFFFLADAFLGT